MPYTGKKRNSAIPSREVIIRTLEEGYRGPAYHGPSVRAVLRRITPAVAAHRVATGRNTPWDLILHLAYERHRMLLRLGVGSRDFPRKLRAPWWPASPAHGTNAQLAADVALLDEYHRRLIAAVRTVPTKNLRRVRPGRARTIAHELLGTAAHDAYHSGQIRLMSLISSRRHR